MTPLFSSRSWLCFLVLASLSLSIPLAQVRGEGEPSFIRKVSTGQAAEVYAPGEALKWQLTLANSDEKKALSDARLSWMVSSWTKTPDANPSASAGEVPVSIGVGAKLIVPIEYTPSVLGWHEMKIELRDAKGKLLEQQARAFSVGKTVRSSARYFRYGICQNLRRHLNTPLFDKVTALAGFLGVDTLRTELASWGTVQPAEGQWRWETADRVLDALTPLGIEVESILGYTARWASTGDINSKKWTDWSRAAPRLDAWHTYVQTVVERYGDRVSYWEIWNEQDIPFWISPTEKYTELFNTTSALIGQISPNAQVLNGGFAMGTRKPNPNFLKEFVPAADKTRWDVVAYHDYHTFAQFLTRRVKVDPIMEAVKPNTPLWINEGGFHTLLAGGEQAQALTLVKKISTAPSRGISAYFWYNLHDDGNNPKNTEHHFGLTRHGGDPKPAWSAYQNVIRELGDARYLRSMPAEALPAGAWAHLYEFPDRENKGGVQHTLVIWQEGSERQVPVWIGVGPEASARDVVDMMGNPVSATLAKNGIVLSLSTEPIYIHLQSMEGHEPQLSLNPLLETPPLLVLVPGEAATLSLDLNNPLDRPVTAQLKISANHSEITFSKASEQLSLAPSGRAQLTTSSRLVGELNAALVAKAEPRIDLALSIPEAGLDLAARIPITLAKMVPYIPTKGFSWEGLSALTPMAVLNHRDDIYNLYSAEPIPEMHWQGVDDLSAVAHLAYDAEALYLEVQARDDVHHQTDVRDKLWESDSLQLGIRLKDTDVDSIEIGLARTNSGKVGGWVFASTPECQFPLGRLESSIQHDVLRDDGKATTTYRLRLPWKVLGKVDDDIRTGGFRLNFIVNDNDGKGRKQWVKLTNGLGEQKAPSIWPIFSCQSPASKGD